MRQIELVNDGEKKYGKNTLSYIPRSHVTSYDIVYHIHDNGRVPFKVVVNIEGIFVYLFNNDADPDESEDTNDSTDYSSPIVEIMDYEGYWYGFDSSGDNYHGNSILIHITKNKYVFIGHCIYGFSTGQDNIIDFISPVGHSDVPYPVAYSENNVYFMCDREYVNRSNFNIDIDVDNAEQIYADYYSLSKDNNKKFEDCETLYTL